MAPIGHTAPYDHAVVCEAHCVYNIETDKWYPNLHFWPGRNGSSAPFGVADREQVYAVTGFTEKHELEFDYAVIKLQAKVGDTVGWLGYGYEEPMPHYTINLAGYPSDKKPSATMWATACNIKDVTEAELYYDCDVAGGMSGGGLYVYFSDDNNRVIYGVQSLGRFGKAWNSGPRINQARFVRIQAWVKGKT